MAFEIFEEVIPELVGMPFDEVSTYYRNWCNAPEQDDIREWLREPLTPERRRTLQARFARNWYVTHGDFRVRVYTGTATTGIPQPGEPSGT